MREENRCRRAAPFFYPPLSRDDPPTLRKTARGCLFARTFPSFGVVPHLVSPVCRLATWNCAERLRCKSTLTAQGPDSTSLCTVPPGSCIPVLRDYIARRLYDGGVSFRGSAGGDRPPDQSLQGFHGGLTVHETAPPGAFGGAAPRFSFAPLCVLCGDSSIRNIVKTRELIPRTVPDCPASPPGASPSSAPAWPVR